MTQLTTCPSCELQLLLPTEAADTGPAECPHCREEFALDEVVRKTLPLARLLAPVDEVPPDPDFAPQKPRLSDTLGNLSLDLILGDKPDAKVDSPPVGDQHNSKTLASWESRLKRAMEDSAPPAEATAEEKQLSQETPPEEASITAPEPASEVPKFAFPSFDDVNDDVDDTSANYEASPEEQPSDDSSLPEGAVVPTEGFAGIELDTTNRRKPDRRSTKRKVLSLVASIVLGAVGIPLGLYALLWIKGPAADHFQIAQYLPNVVLPPTMQSSTGNDTPQSEKGRSADRSSARDLLADKLRGGNSGAETTEEDAELSEQSTSPLIRDDHVQVAAAQLPSTEQPTPELPTIEAHTGAISTEEFESLLEAAQLAVPELVEGDLGNREHVARKGRAYMTLCHLAEKLSAVKGAGIIPAREARDVFANIASNSAIRSDLSLIALRWWQHQGRPTAGFVVVGRVERVEFTELGNISFLNVGSEANSTTIPILSNDFSELADGSVAVVGAIVVPTAEQVSLLPAGVEQLVVVHDAFRVE